MLFGAEEHPHPHRGEREHTEYVLILGSLSRHYSEWPNLNLQVVSSVQLTPRQQEPNFSSSCHFLRDVHKLMRSRLSNRGTLIMVHWHLGQILVSCFFAEVRKNRPTLDCTYFVPGAGFGPSKDGTWDTQTLYQRAWIHL